MLLPVTTDPTPPGAPALADQVSRLYDLVAGYHATHLLEIARELGVWAALTASPGLTSEELASFSGLHTIRDRVLQLSGKSNPTIREFLHYSGRGRVDDAIVGSARDVADVLEERFSARACDGFVIAATHVPGAYADFVEHVVPELQRRGLYHTDYDGATAAGIGAVLLDPWGGNLDVANRITALSDLVTRK